MKLPKISEIFAKFGEIQSFSNWSSLIIWFVIVFFLLIFYIIKNNKNYISKLNNKKDISIYELDEMEEYFEYIPNLWITLGIFGTFLGLSLGLILIFINKQENSKDIYLDIPKILYSIGTAFLTSILGMICSYISKNYYNKYLKKIYEIRENKEKNENQQLLNQFIEFKTEISKLSNNPFSEIIEKLKLETENYSKNLIQGTKSIIEKFEEKFGSINTTLDKVYELINRSFATLENYKITLDAQADQLKIPFTELKNITDSIYKIQNEIKNNINQDYENIKEMFNTIRETKDSLLNITNIVTGFVNNLDNINKNIQELPTTIENLYNKTHSNIDEFIENMNKKLEIFISDLQKQINKFNEETQTSFNFYSEKFNKYFEFSEKFINSLDLSLKNFEKNKEEISIQISEKLKEAFNKFDENITFIFNLINSILENIKNLYNIDIKQNSNDNDDFSENKFDLFDIENNNIDNNIDKNSTEKNSLSNIGVINENLNDSNNNINENKEK